MRKLVAAQLDAETLRLLQTMAQEHEGNLSRTMRECVREAARKRGLSDSQGAQNDRL